MKIITTQLFVTLGVIFVLLVIAGIYFFVADSPGLKEGSVTAQSSSATISGTVESADTAAPAEPASNPSEGFTLSSAQIEALVSLGIDPEAVPASISAEQEACFVTALGEARVAEIKAGAVPNILEFAQAKSCI